MKQSFKVKKKNKLNESKNRPRTYGRPRSNNLGIDDVYDPEDFSRESSLTKYRQQCKQLFAQHEKEERENASPKQYDELVLVYLLYSRYGVDISDWDSRQQDRLRSVLKYSFKGNMGAMAKDLKLYMDNLYPYLSPQCFIDAYLDRVYSARHRLSSEDIHDILEFACENINKKEGASEFYKEVYRGRNPSSNIQKTSRYRGGYTPRYVFDPWNRD